MTTTTTKHVSPKWRDEQVAALRDGRKNRAVTYRVKKGKGSYRRRGKHGSNW